jgi:hypothetical protein
MSAVGHDTVFPRKDNVFKKKESLPFDEAQTIVWKERKKENHEDFWRWMGFIVAGFFTGFTAFCMDKVEDFLIETAVKYT